MTRTSRRRSRKHDKDEHNSLDLLSFILVVSEGETRTVLSEHRPRHVSEAESPYANLYLRHHGFGINSVVPTASPPFIKARVDGDISDASTGGRISFTSNSHEGRQWGLVLCRDGEKLAGWERVEIVEDGGSEGFVFRERNGNEDASASLESSMKDDDEAEGIWRGWIVCERSTGHPQLFWVTHRSKGALPGSFAKVQVMMEVVG